MIRSIITTLIIMTAINGYTQQDIPGHITYHKASDKVNAKAKKMLEKAIENSGEGISFNKTFICGPMLWKHLVKNGIDSKLTGINVNFNIPTKDGVQTYKGKAIQNQKEFTIIWNTLFDTNNTFNVRKPTNDELSYYWSIIPYDIEEPIFVVEINNLKVLVDFSKGQLLHLDLV